VLKEFLGHANIKTTQKYIGRLDEGNRKKIIDKIYDF
jgi:integrase